MSRSQLAVVVYKDLGSEYVIYALLVDEAKVRIGGTFICKIVRNTKKTFIR